jgi:hypothetical protein
MVPVKLLATTSLVRSQKLLALLLALCLLGQPLLCLLHCNARHGATTTSANLAVGIFFCDLTNHTHPNEPLDHGHFIPAYFPGILVALLVLLRGLMLFGQLPVPLASVHRGPIWSPPGPVPRSC